MQLLDWSAAFSLLSFPQACWKLHMGDGKGARGSNAPLAAPKGWTQDGSWRHPLQATVSTLCFFISEATCTKRSHAQLLFLDWQCKNGFCVFFKSQTYTFFIYLTEMSRNCITKNVLTIMKSANSCCGSSCLRWRCTTTLRKREQVMLTCFWHEIVNFLLHAVQ